MRLTDSTVKIDVVTLLPEMWSALDYGVIARARRRKLWQLRLWQLRDFSARADRRVDDRPYGGGPGMILGTQPLHACLQAVRAQCQNQPWVVQLDPSGRTLTQADFHALSLRKNLILVCGRYEGFDQRFTAQHVDECVSVGPYVLSGGDIPAMLLIDGLVRLIPGVLGNTESPIQDSFTTNCLDYPNFTRPVEHDGLAVPEVLRSGNQRAIAAWRRMHALGKTWLSAPHLLRGQTLSAEDVELLNTFLRAQQYRKHTD